MTPDEVLEVIRGAVVTVLEVEPGGLGRETRFADDLRADSLALVEIVEIVEEQLPGAHLEDERLDELATLGDAVDYVMSLL